MFKKGNIPWNVGLKPTEEHRRKAAEARIGLKRSPETVEKIAIANRGKKRSVELRKRMSEAKLGEKNNNYGKFHSEETKNKIRRGVLANPGKVFFDTSIERKIEFELKRREIEYKKQVPLLGVSIVDFYLLKDKIVIQCDGCYWHECPVHNDHRFYFGRREKDEEQDRVLELSGLKVYRFWEHDINFSAEECINRINLK